MNCSRLSSLVVAVVFAIAGRGATVTPRAQEPAVSGQQTYNTYCASCHDQASPRIPPRDALRKLPAARILRTLDFGVMMAVAYPMRRDEREAVAVFLGTTDAEAPLPTAAFCPADRAIMAASPLNDWNGWSATAANTRFQDQASRGLTATSVGRLTLKWAFGFQGDVTAFAAPSILSGTMFVGSASGAVHAIDARAGCLHWVYQANGPVRSALVGVDDGDRRVLVFFDQIGWVYALDARSGGEVWKVRVEEHEATRLTGSPAVHNGLVFVPAASWEETRAMDPRYPCCSFRGSVTALRVRDGSRAWKTFMVDPPQRTGSTALGTPRLGPSGAGIWSTPTVDATRDTAAADAGPCGEPPGRTESNRSTLTLAASTTESAS